jgi:hypothetical protein
MTISKHTKKKLSVRRAQKLANPLGRHTHVRLPIAVVVIGAWTLIGIFTGIFVFLYANSESIPHDQVAVARNPVTFDVQEVRFDVTGAEPFTAPSDQEFVILQVEVKNSTDSIFNLAPVVQTSVTDDSGAHYSMSPAVLDSPLQAGPIDPHGSAKGTLSYLVPKLAKHLVLTFNADAPQPVHTTYTIK